MKKASRFLKRLGCLAMASILALSCLSGCGGGGGSSDGKAKLKVFFFANDHEKEIFQQIIDKFKAAHTDEISDIEFQITTQSEYATTLTGMMTAKDLPDVFYVGPESVKNFVDNGYLADLTPLLSEANISTDDLPQNILNVYRYDGTQTGSGDLYALPKDLSTFAYGYNKDVFDAAGVPYPDPNKPYTYDEFVEVCKKLTMDTNGDGEIDQWGASFADLYMLYPFIWSNGASFTSEDGKKITISDPKFVEALQKYIDLTLVHEVTPTVDQDTALGPYQRWIAGQTGFYAAATWDVASFMDPETFPYNWDLCYYPTLSTGVSYTWSGTVGFCVSATSEHKELAVELASYLSTDAEGQKELSGMGETVSVQLPNPLSLQEEFKQMVADGSMKYPSNVDVMFNYLNGTDYAKTRMTEPTYTPNSAWIDMFWEQLTDVKAGRRDLNEFIETIEPEMQEALDKAWGTAN